MADSGSDSDPTFQPSPSTSPATIRGANPTERQQRTNPDNLYTAGDSALELQQTFQSQSSPLKLPSREAITLPSSSSFLSPIPQSSGQPLQPSSPRPPFQSDTILPSPTQAEADVQFRDHPSKKDLKKSRKTDAVLSSTLTLPDLTNTHLHDKPYAKEPTYFTRPNRYFGPASTWRSWTEEERTVVASLERTRASDLSIHLYNACVLKRRAETANFEGRGRGRSASRRGGRNTSRGRSNSKGKGKAVVQSPDEAESQARGRSHRPSQAQDESSIPTANHGNSSNFFNPPRVWTAWPLPPADVPRETFLPLTQHQSSISRPGEAVYRRPLDPRPSAQLEECLIAVTSRLARVNWERREWGSLSLSPFSPSPSSSEPNSNPDSNSDSDNQIEDSKSNISVDSRPTKRRKLKNRSPRQDTESPPASKIPTFSSQLFTAETSSSSSNASSGGSEDEDDAGAYRPTFSADDDQLRHILLPSTRHTIAQLDRLLRALHTARTHAIQRKPWGSNRSTGTESAGESADRKVRGKIGVRGPEEVFGLAAVVFGPEVVDRARKRFEGLFEGV